MSRLGIDLQGILDKRFRELVGRWLETLATDGWQGTPTDLATELAAKANYADPVYVNPGGKLNAAEDFIRSRGWKLSFSRTATARRVRFDRLKQ